MFIDKQLFFLSQPIPIFPLFVQSNNGEPKSSRISDPSSHHPSSFIHHPIISSPAVAQEELECKLNPSGSSPAALGRCPETPKRNLDPAEVPLKISVENQIGLGPKKHGEQKVL